MIYEGKAPSSTVDHSYTHAAIPPQLPRERTPEEKSADARTIADNFDVQLGLVRAAIAAMTTAAAAGDLAGWTEARKSADLALKQLAHIAQTAPAGAHDATESDVRRRLASAEDVLAHAQELVAKAPAAPQAAPPELSCAEALLAVLPPDPPPAEWRDPDFQRAAGGVEGVCTGQMTMSDIAAFRAIVTRHETHVIARRFHRLGALRRRRLLDLLDRSEVKRAARAREAARRDGPAVRETQGDPPATAEPLSVEVVEAVPDAAETLTTNPAEGSATPHAGAGAGPAEPAERDRTEPREALGAAIAAQVPGVTYDGSGRFLVAAQERQIVATIRRVHNGVPGVRRDGGDSAVLEIPTGLGDGELAAAVAAQLRALQLHPSAQPSSASNAPLPADVRVDMESALGTDLSAVRVHHDGQAGAMGALAFTRGTDIHFAPGRYDPHGPSGRELLGHELTHVAQQAQGRVPATGQINGVAANDDPALEHEADTKGAQAAVKTSGAVAPSTLARPATAGPLQAKPETSPPATPGHQQPTTSEPTSGAGRRADVATAAPMQLQRDEHQPKKQHIPYKIQITRPMSGDEFKVAAHLQMFGAVIPSDWHDVKDRYTPADSPVEILVGVELFRRGRGAANAARGIETDDTGAVAGAPERANELTAEPGSDEKTAIVAEIDRRYYAASGEAAGTKIRAGDVGRSALWRSVRDEVLFQRAYLGNLPDKVKAFIRTGIAGRDLTPGDYDQLFRIAKKIESLPPGEAADCASKLSASTADLNELEATIERYRGEMATREQADQERTAVHNKLVGLEGVYQLYRQYLASAASTANSPAYEKSGILHRHGSGPGIGEQLEQQLKRHGFASIGEFTSFIARYEQAFEDGATAVTLDMLARYAGKLHRESQRYQDQNVVADLHGKLGGFRTQHQEFDKNSDLYKQEVWNAQHSRDAEMRRLPGNGGMPAKPPTQTQVEAKQKAEAAHVSAEAQIKDLSKTYTIFAEDDLPADKRINKVALAQASEAELGSVLQAHITNRLAAVAEARGELEGKHALVYKMIKLMPAFYAQLGIQPGSIHDLIIQDKMRSDAIDKVVSGVLLALVAIALTVVSLGAATPAVVAAGASIGAAGLSTYMAYDEYKQYAEDHKIAEAGLANDPSVVWLVLAVVGAGVDMGAAAGAITKLAPVARALTAAETPLEVEDKLATFHKSVEALREQGQLKERIAAAADKAAAARKSYAAAKAQFKADLTTAAGGARGSLGAFTDPTVFRGLVKMAIAKIREGMHSLDEFIADLKLARVKAQISEMSPEELVKAKEAWAQAEALSNQAKDPELLDRLVERGIDPTTIEQLTAKLDAPALRQLLDHGLPPAQIERLAKMTEPQLKRLLTLSSDQVAAFVALPDAARARYAGLADNLFTRFAALDAAGIERFGTLADAAFAKFAALDASMLRSFAALDVETLRSFAFFDDAVLRRFGAIPPADLAKLTGIDTIALRDFEALDEKALRELLANHGAEDIRVLGNMTPQRWAEAHAGASSLDAGGGHSFAKHGAHTTAAQQETRLRTGVAPDGSVMTMPPDKAGRFGSDAAHVEAAKAAERDLYNNMVGTKGKLKKEYVAEFELQGAGYSYRLDPPGVPPPPYLGGRVVEDVCSHVHVLWRLNPAGTDYILVTMYPVK